MCLVVICFVIDLDVQPQLLINGRNQLYRINIDGVDLDTSDFGSRFIPADGYLGSFAIDMRLNTMIWEERRSHKMFSTNLSGGETKMV